MSTLLMSLWLLMGVIADVGTGSTGVGTGSTGVGTGSTGSQPSGASWSGIKGKEDPRFHNQTKGVNISKHPIVRPVTPTNPNQTRLSFPVPPPPIDPRSVPQTIPLQP